MSTYREVTNIYVVRGYLPILITSWLWENYYVWWDTYLNNNKPAKADMLILKSKYNVF